MKFFLVLSLCSVAAFVMVLRLRPPVAAISPATLTTTAAPAPKPAAPKKSVRTAAGTGRSAVALSSSLSSSEATSSGEESAAVNTEVLLPAPRPGFAQVIVTSETAALYATNSSKSPVVKILQKGDRVETDLNVTDSEGTWSLIRVPDQRVSGYVRNQFIERRRLTSAQY